MKRALTLALACATVAVAASAASAIADPGNGNGGEKGKSGVAKECAALKKADKAAFKAAFGKHAMRDCIKSDAGGIEDPEDLKNAAQQCRAERTADPEVFQETWGTNAPNPNSKGAKRNAFGKCVSATAKQDEEEEPAPTE